MIVTLKKSTRKLLYLIRFSKAAVDMINTHTQKENLQPFYMQMTNGQRKKSGKQQLSELSNNIKYLRVTLTKQMNIMYAKNFNFLKKETEDNIKR